jgi:hypothetical protein
MCLFVPSPLQEYVNTYNEADVSFTVARFDPALPPAAKKSPSAKGERRNCFSRVFFRLPFLQLRKGSFV